jgi:hypothetical protein
MTIKTYSKLERTRPLYNLEEQKNCGFLLVADHSTRINLLKPSGYYMQMLEHYVCVLHMVLTINSDCFHRRHEPVGLCSWDGQSVLVSSTHLGLTTRFFIIVR